MSIWSAREYKLMKHALRLAAQGYRGANPLVGAVIYAPAGEVVSTGYHRGAGTMHAEIDALHDFANTKLTGCTMVVTLEPCNHRGRTGPCTEAISHSGITEVIYAIEDPYAPAAGGAQALIAAGIKVRRGLLRDEAYKLNRRWFESFRAQRPFSTLHIAQTLDARIAAADGTSRWISGPQSLADSHNLRSRIDAILVGTQTIFIDDPQLTARDANGHLLERQPLRVVMGHRDIPKNAAVRGSDGKFLQIRSRDPHAVMRTLWDKGVRHLMIEGGAHISSAFLAADLVDELILYLSPMVLGSGTSALAELGIDTLARAQHWEWDTTGEGHLLTLGKDIKLRLQPAAR